MNKDEILKEISYRGQYTKEVKRKLNKLLKKYHPDNNKSDKKTILILYEIKKDLETGKLEYNDSIVTDDGKKVKRKTNYKAVSFFERMIDELKKRKNKINKEIGYLYKKINKSYEEKDLKQDELGNVDFEVEELYQSLSELSLINTLDKLILVLIFLVWIFTVLFRSILLFLVVVLMVLIEIYYIYVRYMDYGVKLKELDELKKKQNTIKEEFEKIEEDISELEKEELKLKREKSKISNELQYYTYQLSKEKGMYEEDTKNKERGKSM